MSEFDQIFNAIKNDPDNASFTSQGIEPLYYAGQKAKINIVGQAPGRKAQETKIFWNDVSGVRLREWMGVSDDEFYQSGEIAVVPLDFYYPGKAKSGDLPPRKGFAEKWHQPLLDLMPNIELTLLVGSYAQRYYLDLDSKATLTQTVKDYQKYLPQFFPLVHPSPLNYGWLKKNPWYEQDVLPALKQQIDHILR
ncbi:uracil-DNA glycosylase family protein [Paucilactobacillus nenjiangensis]|jgi:uracil-DNA glycosylase|uniref:Uracil-DNA glycosylase family protein n=1 Tax=Paucilactobacillus nenjiangensis TaxID=1296540 RepID=A0A5P1X2N8_9LACO|nr:uracil-DNA glycosylase family protein [Paucilactobacillus nenjiangensis]QER66939.1 uracil-DNA glycosylase family protein [Paucilactobacillus nenjiangensis]